MQQPKADKLTLTSIRHERQHTGVIAYWATGVDEAENNTDDGVDCSIAENIGKRRPERNACLA